MGTHVGTVPINGTRNDAVRIVPDTGNREALPIAHPLSFAADVSRGGLFDIEL